MLFKIVSLSDYHDIAINGTIASVLPVDVHTVNETTSSVIPDDLYRVSSQLVPMIWFHLLQYPWSSKRDYFKYH
jgi:predicted regulator of amino acid metabolism with ACT domain